MALAGPVLKTAVCSAVQAQFVMSSLRGTAILSSSKASVLSFGIVEVRSMSNGVADLIPQINGILDAVRLVVPGSGEIQWLTPCF